MATVLLTVKRSTEMRSSYIHELRQAEQAQAEGVAMGRLISHAVALTCGASRTCFVEYCDPANESEAGNNYAR